MEQFCRDYLLAVADAFGKANHLTLATISRRFHGNVNFLEEFESGKITVTLRKFDEMLEAFKAEWPDNTKWPKARKISFK